MSVVVATVALVHATCVPRRLLHPSRELAESFSAPRAAAPDRNCVSRGPAPRRVTSSSSAPPFEMPSSHAVEDASDEPSSLYSYPGQSSLKCGLMNHTEGSLRDSLRDSTFGSASSSSWSAPRGSGSLRDRFKWAAVSFILLIVIIDVFRRGSTAVPRSTRDSSSEIILGGKTLISYSYFEKDSIQRENFEFFIRHGQPEPSESFFHTIYTVTGQACSPCRALTKKMELVPSEPTWTRLHLRGTVAESLVSSTVTLLRRSETAGRDFGNHDVSLAWVQRNDPSALDGFKYFVFIDSSVKGPFMPHYFSSAWHWSQAFTSLLEGRVKAVGPSLACLPKTETAGPGPRLESHLIATDQEGLSTIRKAGVLDVAGGSRGESEDSNNYALTASLLRAGFNVATLLYKYGEGIDWRDASNWACNDRVHPNRGCSYGGISQHPFETVFVRNSRGLESVAVQTYSQWMDDRVAKTATRGSLDLARYQAAVKHEPICNMEAAAPSSPKPQRGSKRHGETLVWRAESPYAAPEGPERPGQDPMNPLDLWTGPILGPETNRQYYRQEEMRRRRQGAGPSPA